MDILQQSNKVALLEKNQFVQKEKKQQLIFNLKQFLRFIVYRIDYIYLVFLHVL